MLPDSRVMGLYTCYCVYSQLFPGNVGLSHSPRGSTEQKIEQLARRQGPGLGMSWAQALDGQEGLQNAVWTGRGWPQPLLFTPVFARPKE